MDVLVTNYASLMEYRLHDESKMTNIQSKADIVVNPSYGSLVGKIIIINLPVDVPIDKLSQFNKIISRFPIGYGIEIKPYELPKDRKSIDLDDYSCLILNKDMLLDIDYAEAVESGNFLIGTDTIIDDEVTLAGYLLLRTNLEELVERVQQGSKPL